MGGFCWMVGWSDGWSVGCWKKVWKISFNVIGRCGSCRLYCWSLIGWKLSTKGQAGAKIHGRRVSTKTMEMPQLA